MACLQTPESLLDVSRKADVLHVAPEPFFGRALRSVLECRYITLDLNQPGVDIHCSLDATPLPDECLDLILCSSVLQFVRNDVKALGELLRILRPGGTALISVPIHSVAQDYFENCGYRKYDTRFIELVMEVGFTVREVEVSDILTSEDCKKLGIRVPDTHPLFIASKPRNLETSKPRNLETSKRVNE
jgi:SAM-dependent methyltransferase